MKRMLTKEERSNIRHKAKNMKARSCILTTTVYRVWFENVGVAFQFFPLNYTVRIDTMYLNHENCHFTTIEEGNTLKRNIDKAIKFIAYLEEFNAKLPNKEV